MPKLLNDVSGRTTEPAGAIVSAIAPVYEDESDAAVAAMRAAHPYEEPAFHVLRNEASG